MQVKGRRAASVPSSALDSPPWLHPLSPSMLALCDCLSGQIRNPPLAQRQIQIPTFTFSLQIQMLDRGKEEAMAEEDESRKKANKRKQKKKEKGERSRAPGFHINDHRDVLVEVLTRLDARSLGLAACVCRLWSAICRHDALWESLCHRQVAASRHPGSLRPVVAALGGYRRLYTACLGPALARLRNRDKARRLSLSLSLSLSLFSIDCYERLGGRRLGDAPSLLFLCPPLGALEVYGGIAVSVKQPWVSNTRRPSFSPAR